MAATSAVALTDCLELVDILCSVFFYIKKMCWFVNSFSAFWNTLARVGLCSVSWVRAPEFLSQVVCIIL